jgi:metallophosphoesterase superfamily enzyme
MPMRVHDEWLLTPQRVAVHEPTATAVVADLHLGYCEARRDGGDAVPLVAVAKTLEPLGRALGQTKATRLVIAGDLFEKQFVLSLWQELTAWLNARSVTLAGMVLGNHDRRWDAGLDVPVQRDACPLDAWQIVHGHLPDAGGRIVCGHWHPALVYAGRRSPCYLVKEDRLVLPAYSLDASGADVWSLPGWDSYRCLVIAGSSVIDVGPCRGHADVVSGAPRPRARKSRPWQGRLRPG